MHQFIRVEGNSSLLQQSSHTWNCTSVFFKAIRIRMQNRSRGTTAKTDGRSLNVSAMWILTPIKTVRTVHSDIAETLSLRRPQQAGNEFGVIVLGDRWQ